jgi:hypothetical protein
MGTINYENIYLQHYGSPREACQGIGEYLVYYNQQRPHQSLDFSTPAEVYFGNKGEEQTPSSSLSNCFDKRAYHNVTINLECEHMETQIYKVGALLLDENSRLLVVRKRSVDRLEYIMPGGKQNPGETDEETLSRELREELGITVTSST